MESISHLRLWHLCAVLLCAACSAQSREFSTAVTPLPSEDIASDCHYSLTIPAPDQQVKAIWVIFDRGRDVHDLYRDRKVIAFARHLRIALLLHGHCPGKAPDDRDDMNMIPEKGLETALFRAIAQFASESGHRELPDAKFIFLGFSGAGPLCARLVGSVPGRTLAAILSAPGHYDPVGINTVELDRDAVAVPELIITGSEDKVSGTARPYAYFLKYASLGAPWAFIVQNNSPHCCTGNAKHLMIDWLQAIVEARQSSDKALRNIDEKKGWRCLIKTAETNTTDSFGLKTFRVADATIESVRRPVPQGWKSAGWLPNHHLAQEWLTFVRQQYHPVLPL